MSSAIARIEGRAPAYLPSWRARTGSSGVALLHALSHFADIVGQSLDRAPDKHFLAFLDAMGVTLLSPRPARVPLVFTVTPDAPVDFSLPRDSQVGAVIPPALPSSVASSTGASPPATPAPVVFATDRSISLVRATLGAVVSVVPATDSYARHAPVAGPTRLFADLEQVPHHLYLGHDPLFELPASAVVSLQVAVHGGGRSGTALRWEYWTDEGWLAFEPVVDQTRGLAVDGEIVLRKLCGPPAAKTTVGGTESYWIRARAVAPLPQPGAGDLPRIDTFRARVGFGNQGLPLDAAFADGLRLDTSKEFMPFGPQPAVGNAFTVACDDAFKRVGARIELLVDPSPVNSVTSSARELAWEYSAGPGVWKPLLTTDEQFQSGSAPRPVRFGRPDDWAKVAVNGDRQFWLRVRLAKGGYGGPLPATVFTPPVLKGMTVGYTVETGPRVPDHCVSLNRFDLRDHSEACRWGRDPFEPVVPVPDRVPALYLGFTHPLPIGLVSVLASVEDEASAGTEPAPSGLDWEYRSPRGWSELLVLDGTGGLQRTGMIEFIGPTDLVADAGPDGPLFWVRAVWRNVGAEPEPIRLAGLHLNAVWATHRSSVRGEVLGRSDGSPRLVLRTQHRPVLGGETIEVQEWRGPGRSWETLFTDVRPDDLHVDRDASGAVVGVWITWHHRPHLYSSGPRDRDYTIERRDGLLRFGDGTSGMIVPPGAPVRASYDYEAGTVGNLPAGTITQLLSAAPYVEAVSNPLPASGGADGEALVESVTGGALRWGRAARSGRSGVRRRGPQQLRHRGRALAASDYEWLARDASPAVAVARCVSATGPDGPTPGWVTVVVAPWDRGARPQPSPELLRTVRAHLAERAPAAVAPFIRVVGPAYQVVSVTAHVVIADVGSAAEVEERLRRALDDFLHPVLGGADTGWQFGDTLHLSRVAQVVEGVVGVDRATALQLSSDSVVFGDRVPIPPDRLPAPGPHVLDLGADPELTRRV